MKRKRHIFKKQATAVVLGFGLLLQPFGSENTYVKAQSFTSAEQWLASLTQAQREALQKLQTTDATGLHLDAAVDWESEESVSIIVEFKTKPGKVAVLEAKARGEELSLADAKQKADASHARFNQEINQLFSENEQIDYKIQRTYKHAFNGVAMTIPAKQAKELLHSAVVKAIWSNQEVQVEQPAAGQEAVGLVSAQVSGSLELMGVDALHAEGYKGRGIKIGILDTGMDYHHPDLKDAYKGGYDFVDNDEDPMETTYEDWKKSGKPEKYLLSGATYYTEHGTHVAGIIGGRGTNDSPYKMAGVAPEADLYAYRVLRPYGMGTIEDIMAGIDKAVADGMDVINLSLGVGINDPLNPVSTSINQAVLNGTTAIVSAGNSGKDMYTLGSPGTAALALTVGASSEPYRLTAFKGTLQIGGETVVTDLRQMAKGYSDDSQQFNGKSFSLVDVGFGSQSDYRNKDIKGKIALISRGNNITLNDKMKYAKQNGAVAALLYNDNPQEGHIPSFLGEGLDFLPTFSLTNAEGLALKAKVISLHTFTFQEMGQVQTKGDALADFSSRGPARITYDLKPEVTAPGVTVLSTVPSYMINKENQSDYQYAYKRLSGTSMAAPHVAGVSALLLQANPGLEPSDVKATLMNTADPLQGDYSVYEVGAGRIDAYEAVHATMKIKVLDETPIAKKEKEKYRKEEPGAISFGTVNLSEDIKEERSLVLSNTGNEPKTFHAEIKFHTNVRGAKDAQQNVVTMTVEPTIKLSPKQERKTTAAIFIPKTAEKGIYEGHIVYTNQNDPNETYQVPFAVHTVEEGIEMFQLSSLGLSKSRDDGGFGNTLVKKDIHAQLELKSNMRAIDFILMDGKTNQDIGHLGSINGLQKSEGVLYELPSLFKGYYYPLNVKSGMVSETPVETVSGYYKIKMVAISDNGNVFTEIRDILVDGGQPQYKFDAPDIIEYEEGQTSVSITGSVHDLDIKGFQAAGMKIDQSANKIAHITGNQGDAPKELPVNVDGTFQYEMPIGPYGASLAFVAMDAAGNGAVGAPKLINVIKKGTPYVLASLDKKVAKPGDTVKLQVALKNAVDFKKSSLNLGVLKEYFDIERVDLHPESQKLGEVKLTQIASNRWTFEAAEGNTQALNGEVPLLEATLKAKDYNFDKNVNGTTVYISQASYQNSSGKTISIIANRPTIEFEPTYSKVKSLLYAEGLLKTTGSFDSTRDYSTIGAQVYIKDAQGNMYDQLLTKYGRIEALRLALTEEPLHLHINVPGHFKSVYTFQIGLRNGAGEAVGQFKQLSVPKTIGGDVTGDDVIDIMDALTIQAHWGTNERSVDINFDGIVDAKDMAFVEKNYLQQNPTIESASKPKERYEGKVLEDIKQELGI